MLGRLVNEFLTQAPPEYPWGDTLPVFATADLRICNLECCLSDRGTPWVRTPKVFHFRSDAKNVAVLQVAALSVVSLANNHVLDYGEEALGDTLDILERAGIAHAGAGRNLAEASRPAIVHAGTLRLGVLAFTDNEPAWEATEDRPGIRYVPVDVDDERAQRLFDDVVSLREQVDLVVVSAHWGPNWGYRPRPHHVPFGRRLIDAGAAIVFGHSCHVFQGIEIYRGRPIIYSAGDFVDDYAVDEVERNDESFIFVVETHEATITRLLLYPTVIRDFQARLARGAEAQRIATKMRALCTEMGGRPLWRAADNVLELPVQ